MTKRLIPSVLILAVFLGIFCGCRSVHSVDYADPEVQSEEGTIVFTRPDRYSIFGNRSLSDFFEVAYERFETNKDGQKVVEVGFCFRGATNWYDSLRKMPEVISMAAQTNFYQDKNTHSGAPVYSTNRQVLTVRRGDTVHYRAVCPHANINGYQLVLSEAGELKR